MNKLFFVCAVLLLTQAQAGELYRSIDENGKVHYSDRPLPDTDDVARLKLGKEPAPDDSLPYETQKAKQFFPVTLYVFSECGACTEARTFLQNRGIPYTEKVLSTQEDFDEYRKISGDNKAPAITIGKTWFIGFLADRWNKELDFAGYPKSAPLRARPAAKPATPPAQ